MHSRDFRLQEDPYSFVEERKIQTIVIKNSGAERLNGTGKNSVNIVMSLPSQNSDPSL